MKELGNLAIVCAKRSHVLMQVLDGNVTVHAGCGPKKTIMTAEWHNDSAIRDMIRQLNFGRLSPDKRRR